MHKFFTSSFDASIYLQQPEQNAGRDEILEVGKLYYGSTMDIARTLIKFDTTQISASLKENNLGSTQVEMSNRPWKIYLNLKSANSEEIPLNYTLYASALSSSWSMGTGTKFDNITSDGVSWKYRNGSTTTKWVDYDTTAGTAVYVQEGFGLRATTGSANAEGGVWYLSGSASQSFSNEPDDVRMDITELVSKVWFGVGNSSWALANNGLILHHHISASLDEQDYGVLKFFSKETNTIYEPKLELVWDDSLFTTGSLSAITGSNSSDALENTKITITDLKGSYTQNSKTKIRVKGRELYPKKSFDRTFSYDTGSYLPTSSYYQIKDYITNETIVPFGEYSKLSCDNKSNYFYLDTSSYPTDRSYKLELKIVKDGITKLIDEKLIFEINK
jgi:hypothetical protein